MDILAKYGIKEVCDVTFYDIDEDGSVGGPVLFLDTLKVSGIEQTAEQTEARGGMGNPVLLIWDFGKEITVNMEDALFSMKSLEVAYGGTLNQPKAAVGDTEAVVVTIRKRFSFRTVAGQTTLPESFPLIKGSWVPVKEQIVAIYKDDNTTVTIPEGATSIGLDEKTNYVLVADIPITDPTKATELVIKATDFPGTYYVVGDTYARNSASGRDEAFQLVWPKAKMSSEQNFELSADGDPAVFNFSLRLLRPADQDMMKLIKYEIEATHDEDEVEITP